jgi:hypothetical protein
MFVSSSTPRLWDRYTGKNIDNGCATGGHALALG